MHLIVSTSMLLLKVKMISTMKKTLKVLKVDDFNEVDLNLADEAIDQIIDWIDKD